MGYRRWAAVQRGPIALDRITERTLCVIDDDQIAGYERFPSPVGDGVLIAASGRSLVVSSVPDYRVRRATRTVRRRDRGARHQLARSIHTPRLARNLS